MDKPRHPHVIRTWTVERIQNAHQRPVFRKPRPGGAPQSPPAPAKHQPIIRRVPPAHPAQSPSGSKRTDDVVWL